MSFFKRNKQPPSTPIDIEDEFETLYIYVNNFPSNSISPSVLTLENKKIFSIDESVGPNEVYILNPKVPCKLYRNQLIVNLKIKIPKLKVEHYQQFDITKSGNFVTIGLDKEGTLRIHQSHDEPQIPNNHTLITKFGELPKKLPELKKIEKLYLKLDNLPGHYDDPFQILIDGKLIHQFQKPVLLETNLVIKLPYPQDKFTFGCKNKSCKKNFEKIYISENGEHFKIITRNKEIIVEQNQNTNFKEKVEYSKKFKIFFYIMNCTDTSLKPFILGSSGSILFEGTEMPEFKGIYYEFPVLENNDDFILNIEVIHPSQAIMEEINFNITKDGVHIIMECLEVGRMIFLQRIDEPKWKEVNNGRTKNVLENDGKSKFIFPEEVIDDNEENIKKLEFYKEKGFISNKEFKEKVLKFQ